MKRLHVLLARSPESYGGGSAITAVDNTVDKKQVQGEATGYVLRTGPKEGPGFRWKLTCRGQLDRLGRSSKAYGPFWGWRK